MKSSHFRVNLIKYSTSSLSLLRSFISTASAKWPRIESRSVNAMCVTRQSSCKNNHESLTPTAICVTSKPRTLREPPSGDAILWMWKLNVINTCALSCKITCMHRERVTRATLLHHPYVDFSLSSPTPSNIAWNLSHVFDFNSEPSHLEDTEAKSFPFSSIRKSFRFKKIQRAK